MRTTVSFKRKILFTNEFSNDWMSRRRVIEKSKRLIAPFAKVSRQTEIINTIDNLERIEFRNSHLLAQVRGVETSEKAKGSHL